jgi:hypothetical protein
MLTAKPLTIQEGDARRRYWSTNFTGRFIRQGLGIAESPQSDEVNNGNTWTHGSVGNGIAASAILGNEQQMNGRRSAS